MSKITLKDIANDTGYSVSTVSRVLNGSSKISSKTKTKVLESVERHDYRSFKVRNATSSTQFLNVALLASGFHEGEFYISFFHGLNQAAQNNNIRLYLAGLVDPNKESQKLIEEITLNFYDGAIVFIPEYRKENYEKLQSMIPSRFPIVSNALIENPVFSTITFDSYSGGHLAAVHLHEKGHRKVGILKGPVERAESRFRFNGFVDYVRQQDDMELRWIFDGDFTFEKGHDAFEEFEQLARQPTAIFASNDDMCNGFMEAAIERNYCFPNDIAIIGYDDLPVCRHNRPTMSSIHTDYKQLGEATMKLLREKLADPNGSSNILSFVPVSISEREST